MKVSALNYFLVNAKLHEMASQTNAVSCLFMDRLPGNEISQRRSVLWQMTNSRYVI